MATSNSSSLLALLEGRCPLPFLSVNDYPSTEGAIFARLCAPVPTAKGNITCCLPCPETDWVYPESFNTLSKVASWINVAGLVWAVYMLLSYWILPVDKTHRHYLSISLIISVILMQLAYVVPLITKPQQCLNEITPKDMYSDTSCAFSGAFLLGGGWSMTSWVFLRALSLHLQICWQVVPGKKFFYAAEVIGWAIPAIFLTVALYFTGVSYRFGTTCHINHKHALPAFWGPLLVMAGLCIIVQFSTFVYCIYIFMKSLIEGGNGRQDSTLPSHHSSIRSVSARAAYKRVMRVLEIQWRGILIVLLVLADVVFFSSVLLRLDTASGGDDLLRRAKPWLQCLVLSGGDKAKCLPQTRGLVPNEATVLAVLFMFAANGFWNVVLLGKWSLFTGWIDMFRDWRRRPRNALANKGDFVSLDAASPVPVNEDSKSFELKSTMTMSTIAFSTIASAVSPEPQLASNTASTTTTPAVGPLASPTRRADYFSSPSRQSTRFSPRGSTAGWSPRLDNQPTSPSMSVDSGRAATRPTQGNMGGSPEFATMLSPRPQPRPQEHPNLF